MPDAFYVFLLLLVCVCVCVCVVVVIVFKSHLVGKHEKVGLCVRITLGQLFSSFSPNDESLNDG